MYRDLVSSNRALVSDGFQNLTSCIPFQPSDSSQACQVALNKLVAQREMLTRDMDANEEEQQSFSQESRRHMDRGMKIASIM